MDQKKMGDVEDDVFLAYLRNQVFEGAEAYAKRGRPLAGISTEELKDRWVKGIQRWAKAVVSLEFDIETELRRVMSEIETELSNRNVVLPIERVHREKAALLEAFKLVLQNSSKDPTRLLKAEERVRADIAAFRAKSKESPSH